MESQAWHVAWLEEKNVDVVLCLRIVFFVGVLLDLEEQEVICLLRANKKTYAKNSHGQYHSETMRDVGCSAPLH